MNILRARQLYLHTCILALLGVGATGYAAPVTLGNAFVNASATVQAGSFSPSNAIDAESASSSRWQANVDASITLDAGAPSLMKGLYLWMGNSNNRTYWIKIETSKDGQKWTPQWRAITTKKNPNGKPVYLSFPVTQDLVRFVKISGAGNLNNNQTRITEARWLAEGQAVATNAHIHQAHWHTSAPPPLDPTNSTPYTYSWTLDGTQHLGLGSMQYVLGHHFNCPLNDARVFPSQLIGIDATGEMNQFLTIKDMPDGSIAYAMDWLHVDLTQTNPGAFSNYAAPDEMGEAMADYISRLNAVGTTREAGEYPYGCDPLVGDSYHTLGFYYSEYYNFIASGQHATHIIANWDTEITPEIDPEFVIPTSVGIPFERVTGTEGEFDARARFASDGFIDSDSRWSVNTTSTNQWGNPQTPTLIFSTGPGGSSNATVRGLYVWTHRSNVRGNKISVATRTDGGYWMPIKETTLPQVPESQPVFIPLTAGEVDDLKHVRIIGLGNDGGGNSDPNWASINEVRYSDSPTPPAGITSISTKTAHAVAGNAFCSADISAPRDIPWSEYVAFQNNNYFGTGVETVLDGNVAASNYWSSDGQVSLNLDLCSSQKVSKINLWMHKSNLRTSNINVYARSATIGSYESAAMTNVHIPMSAPTTPTIIEFNPAIVAGQINLEFFGNSISHFSSVAEVSWE